MKMVMVILAGIFRLFATPIPPGYRDITDWYLE